MTPGPDPIVVFLNPGEYFVGDERHRIRTLLGSCVSITLWHPGLRVGAMSHFLLSERAARTLGPLDGRYGKEARRMLEARGIRIRSESLFGEGHRRILFDVRSGHVWSRQVKIESALQR